MSSLIFAALAVAWLVVLVPMVARRRQEVVRTADSALAARVLRRGGARRAGPASSTEDGFDMADPDNVDPAPGGDDYDAYDRDAYGHDGYEHGDEPGHDERIDLADEPGPARRYRPGRGGFDPDHAAAVARAKYQFRQRVVLAMLLLALVSGVLAFVAVPLLWWVHGALDVLLVGYLTYLRRQVRIEEEVRQRRLARLAGARRRAAGQPHPTTPAERDEQLATPPHRSPRPGALVVEIDDEDPAFDELDAPTPFSYRRAVGE
ncbi:hypothetical protein LX15_005670 [Streptoalloteichus tenebrarius]|uniref:Transmembrane protein n=1 Tax=Streptoalloteichus tenebrarius (strain ATCC 17920 / DSM 40477 / JCM 4838 / CBS 697.72 / NBRC 16177 / NCIMB 11028 / NRRL B-12390 / A12253. 1 / ISP 5477) TaxID=1933 RepID=A0ABT1I2D3_STRSD|nr:gephyrin-like molybdotransferase receptor GlpR [Streptoalloteichus tenebrarius]MCP2261943.1 hypothetical protein [Streptoalloteichus tenebrarius]BFF01244.1 hypothetical protein GCM10020241_29190 [Streptoalloteichus tenebrarius]